MDHGVLAAMRWVAIAVFILAATVSVPAAQAQSAGQFKPSLELHIVSQPSSPLAPNGAAQPIVVQWVYTLRETTTAALVQPAGSTTIRFTPIPTCDLPGIIVSGPAAVTVQFESGANALKTQYDGVVMFAAVATQDAPGETVITCRFHAIADAVNSQVVATESEPATAQVFAAYSGILTVDAPVTIQDAAPGSPVVFELVVTNIGNSRSNIVAQVVGDAAQGGWKAVPPPQTLVASAQQGAELTQETLRFTIDTPRKAGWNNNQTTFTLRLTPVSAVNPEQQGSAVLVNVLARVRGCYMPDGVADASCHDACGMASATDPQRERVRTAAKASPAVHPALAVGLLLVAAVAMRRDGRN